MARDTFYRRKKEDKDFKAAVRDALATATDALELEARRRAKDGTDEPVFWQGEQCGTVKKYSDTLLIFLLKAHRPGKYRERHEVKHKVGGDPDAPPIKAAGVLRIDPKAMTTEELELFVDLIDRAAGNPVDPAAAAGGAPGPGG